MGIWLLIVFYWTTNQKTFLVQIFIYKKWDGKTNLQRGWEKGPRRNTRLPKKHPFYSRPEALRTTFRLYKNSMFQTLETLVSFNRTSSSLFFTRYSFSYFSRKAKIVCLLSIVSKTCFNKNYFSLFVKQQVFSILWVTRQSSHSYYSSVRRRSGGIVSSPLRGSFKHSVGTEEFESKQSEANVVVTNTIATTSTVTSSHTTLGSVTSIGPQHNRILQL